MEKNLPSYPQFTMPMRGILLIAGMYTVAWGAFFKWFGSALINWFSFGEPRHMEYNLFGTFGLIIGIVLFLSAFYPINWRWLILVGIIGKIILAIWFGLYYLEMLGWNKRTAFHLLFNEIIWLLPLSYIYMRALKVTTYLQSLG
ncbi:hypothetical protein [Anditalea andensis]|uniref:Uncharacterized protein n=1 Tax=Anditalea andensis TaxID=1048983 RepID=A0A074KUL8_9BACT|nr:hypothetical protein [Anditalea andensis]KEO73651.1 hypothetical protein EL17_12185 [Anditalea andensis]